MALEISDRPERTLTKIALLTRIVMALVFSFCLLAACTVPAGSGSRGGGATESPKGDAWQRTKDCTEQSDRVVRQNGWVNGQLADGKYLFGEVTFIEQQSHYSPKYERCYLRVTFFTSQAPDDKISFYHLYDAFEGRLLAVCNGGSAGRATSFCSIEEQATSDSLLTGGRKDVGNCEACRRFVEDRWNN